MWFEERLYDDIILSYNVIDLVYETKNIKVYNTKKCGLVYTLEDIVQTTQMDEFIYNEMLSHIAVGSVAKPINVLVIGIGTGGCIRELKRHNLNITAVDINFEIYKLAELFETDISGCNIKIDCGYNFVKKCKDKFDCIIIDSPDPVGQGAILYSDDFYKEIKRLLKDDGCITTQWGVPMYQPEEITQNFRSRSKQFNVDLYVAPIPTYHGGFMVFARMAKIMKTNISYNTLDGQYYNADIHQACFAIPTYIKKLK